MNRRYPSDKLHEESGISWLDSERKERCCIETFKALHNLSSDNVNKLFVPTESDRSMRSTDTNRFRVPMCRTKFGDGNLPNRCSTYWHTLSRDVRQLNKLTILKSALKKGEFFQH